VPFVRGSILPEVESTGAAKHTLDVLLSLERVDIPTLTSLDELEQLRVYLASLLDTSISIRLFFPTSRPEIQIALQRIGIECRPMPSASALEGIPKQVVERLEDSLKVLLSTALHYNVDCVVSNNSSLLPYAEEFGEVGVLLTSADFLLRYSETFARGHDVPWAFNYKVWFEPWTSFYQLSESWTFRAAMDFLRLCQSKDTTRDAVELCRSLAFNRLGDLCFTRDRLCFYEMQKAVAKRAGWKRQKFSAEVAYYLNFYYLLLYGAFDHAAVLVNALFNLGIKERQVGARNPEFLKALATKAGGVQAVFEKPSHVAFIRRVAALRNIAAHRDVLTPTKVVRDLDHPPTNDELDQDIRDAGLDHILLRHPPGMTRDGLQEMLRSNAPAARYEQETLMEDVVLIEIDDTYGFIHPLGDTWFNFKSCLSFLNDVFSACTEVLG
jgi:hypothetical protein